jgi:uncharacterized protein YjbI with pentapeptide repeats
MCLVQRISKRDEMNINRRNMLFSTAAFAATATRPEAAQAHNYSNRVSQDELNEAIRLHRLWLADINTGQRCVFGVRDLSGLQFRMIGGEPINLSGADFAQADLSGTEADDIPVHHCNFNGATLEGCRWRRPVFAYADMRRISAKGAEWGIPAPRGSVERSLVDFSHAVLFDANLDESRICGFFYGTKLRGASLKQADLSYSDFLGPKYHEMSFSGARLTRAKLRHCDMSSVSFFKADCSGVDFSDTVFSDVRMRGCNLTGASFKRTEIERTTFAFDQVAQSKFLRWNG